jgi:hypothetical protein
MGADLRTDGTDGGDEMAQEPERARIAELESGQFSYNYANDDPDVLEFFESLGLQGGGDTWAALARAGLELAQSRHIGDIEFDPDAQEMFAYSDSRAALEELAGIVARIAADDEFREQCLALAEENGELE